MLNFHQFWFYVAVGSTGFVGLWGIVVGLAKRDPGRSFAVARTLAIAAMLIQVGAGLWLWGQGLRPGDSFHVFYGVVIAATFSFAYTYRVQFEQRPALMYGILLLFVMGLGLRAWANVG